MDKPYGIVYKVTNIVNGKMYIGRTTQGLYKRKWSHESRARNYKNTTFYKAIRKYGENNFVWEIIEECNDKDTLNAREIHYIEQYDSFGRSGYNETIGGEGVEGYKHTKEVCEAIRKQKTGIKLSQKSIDRRSLLQSYIWKITYPNGKIEIVRNLAKFCKNSPFELSIGTLYNVAYGRRNHHKGFKCEKLSKRSKKCSVETRNKISIGNLGKKPTIEQLYTQVKAQNKVWLIKTPDGDQVKVTNLKTYCIENFLKYGSMLSVARGEKKTYKGGYVCEKLSEQISV